MNATTQISITINANGKSTTTTHPFQQSAIDVLKQNCADKPTQWTQHATLPGKLLITYVSEHDGCIMTFREV